MTVSSPIATRRIDSLRRKRETGSAPHRPPKARSAACAYLVHTMSETWRSLTYKRCGDRLRALRELWFACTVGLFRADDEIASEDLYQWCPFVVFMLALLQVLTFVLWIASEDSFEDNSSATAEDAVGPPDWQWRLFEAECYVNVTAGTATVDFEDKRVESTYRVFLYALVQLGWGHLLANVAVQLFLGMPLEIVHGHFVGIILVGASMGGALTAAWTDPLRSIVGGGPLTYGVIGAHVGHVILNAEPLDCFTFFVRFFVLLGAAVVQYAPLFADGGLFANGAPHSAHLGAFISGLLLSLCILGVVLRSSVLPKLVQNYTQTSDTSFDSWVRGFSRRESQTRMSLVVSGDMERTTETELTSENSTRPRRHTGSNATSLGSSRPRRITGSNPMIFPEEQPRTPVYRVEERKQSAAANPNHRGPGCCMVCQRVRCCSCCCDETQLCTPQFLWSLGLIGSLSYLLLGVAWVIVHDEPSVPTLVGSSTDVSDAWWDPYDPSPADLCL